MYFNILVYEKQLTDQNKYFKDSVIDTQLIIPNDKI